MEAQAAAQQLAAQQAAQAAVLSRGRVSPGSCKERPVSPPSAQASVASSDEPTDLSLCGKRKVAETTDSERERERAERERYYSQLMERYNIERSSPARDRSEERDTEHKTHFDYRHLIPASVHQDRNLLISTGKEILTTQIKADGDFWKTIWNFQHFHPGLNILSRLEIT